MIEAEGNFYDQEVAGSYDAESLDEAVRYSEGAKGN